jgi:FtsP/CotA-like multicopper oxidase with cupredoxin domain
MSLHRRDFLKGLAAGATLAAGGLPTLARAVPKISTLSAALVEQILTPGGGVTNLWGYNGSVPGPLLRFRKGETVRIPVKNGLPADTTVHWHGLRIPNAMDGVPYVTQNPIKPGETFDYEFTVPDSGTFWYHPHQSSYEQVPRGLYGPLIVDEDKPITVDQDVVWVISDAKLEPDGRQVEDFGRVLDLANEGRLGNVVLINGLAAGAERSLRVRSGDRVRLRLINAAASRVFKLAFAGHVVQAIAFDGQAVTPHPLEEVYLGPGMRVDLVIDCMHAPGSSFTITDSDRRSLGELARIAYTQEKPRRSKPLKAPIALKPNRIAEPDLAKATDHYIVFQGGMRGAPVIGQVDGKPSKIQDIMEKYGLAWTMNFSAQHEHALMHEPLLYLKKGEHVMLRMINETDFVHPMHLHGHFFRVIAIDGAKTQHQEWRDTVMMGPRQTVDVAFVADAVGEWMYHCHILDHAAGGMMGTIAVE